MAPTKFGELWRACRIRQADMPATPARVWAAIEAGGCTPCKFTKS
jgi:hypothetical protein